jgi:single-stranded DNA-binding protein
MSKIGVNLSINVKDIIKQRLVTHQNGKVYLNMTAFIDTDNQGQYGDNGMITHAKLKDEQGQMQILGNAKVFWKEDSAPPPQQQAYGQYQGSQQAPQQQYAPPPPQNQPMGAHQQAPEMDNFDDDIPFS